MEPRAVRHCFCLVLVLPLLAKKVPSFCVSTASTGYDTALFCLVLFPLPSWAETLPPPYVIPAVMANDVSFQCGPAGCTPVAPEALRVTTAAVVAATGRP